GDRATTVGSFAGASGLSLTASAPSVVDRYSSPTAANWSAAIFDTSSAIGSVPATLSAVLRPEMSVNTGSDVLVGGSGDDLVVGIEGRNLLVGGYASSSTGSQDVDHALLDDLMAHWTTTNESDNATVNRDSLLITDDYFQQTGNSDVGGD